MEKCLEQRQAVVKTEPVRVISLACIENTGSNLALRKLLLPYSVELEDYKQLTADLKAADLIDGTALRTKKSDKLNLTDTGQEVLRSSDLAKASLDIEVDALVRRNTRKEYDFLSLLQDNSNLNEGWLLHPTNDTALDLFTASRLGQNVETIHDVARKLELRSLVEMKYQNVGPSQSPMATNARIIKFGEQILTIIFTDHALEAEGIKPNVDRNMAHTYISPDGHIDPRVQTTKRLRDTYASMRHEYVRMTKVLNMEPVFSTEESSIPQARELPGLVMMLADEMWQLEQKIDSANAYN